MSGIQEILIILLLILALLVLPRVIPSKRQSNTPDLTRRTGIQVSGKLRLALLLSLLWLFVFSAIYVPWKGQWAAFLYVGVGPILFAWGLYWVFKGFGNVRRR